MFRVFSSSFGLPFVACAFRSSLITKFAVEQKAHLQVFKSWWNGWGDSEVNMGKIRIEAKIMCWNIASASFPIVVFFLNVFIHTSHGNSCPWSPGPSSMGPTKKNSHAPMNFCGLAKMMMPGCAAVATSITSRLCIIKQGFLMWVFPKKVLGPPNHPFVHRVFDYKPSILGYPYFWKHPCSLRVRNQKGYIHVCDRICFYLSEFLHLGAHTQILTRQHSAEDHRRSISLHIT